MRAKDRNISVHVTDVDDQIGRRIARRGQVQQIPDSDVQVVDVLGAAGGGLRHCQVNHAEQTGGIQRKVVDIIAGEHHRLGGDQVGDIYVIATVLAGKIEHCGRSGIGHVCADRAIRGGAVLHVPNRLDVYNVGGWGIASNQDLSRVRLKNQQVGAGAAVDVVIGGEGRLRHPHWSRT